MPLIQTHEHGALYLSVCLSLSLFLPPMLLYFPLSVIRVINSKKQELRRLQNRCGNN